MALDWIKMRAELRTHPRFLSLCSHLIYNPEVTGMLVYACGEDLLGQETVTARHETVTQRALRRVTERALRDVTMCALLRVWCAVNSHCKVSEHDAVCSPMALSDLDDIAGFSGFGGAMCQVAWVVETERNTLTFPNFLEFNEPACMRAAPKSAAERARAYRQRRISQQQRVTRVTKRHGREEKRREEKNRENTTPLPPSLDTPEFRAAWDEWRSYRREKKKTMTPRTEAAQLKKLADWGPARASAAITHSIASGYQGIYEGKDRPDVGPDFFAGKFKDIP